MHCHPCGYIFGLLETTRAKRKRKVNYTTCPIQRYLPPRGSRFGQKMKYFHVYISFLRHMSQTMCRVIYLLLFFNLHLWDLKCI
ncbi:hypothetical protein NMG60_11022645 [Bertholletia excelsa]